MSDLARGEDMEWEQTIILKAIRIRSARHQQKRFREELAKKQETECNLAEFGSWIWGGEEQGEGGVCPVHIREGSDNMLSDAMVETVITPFRRSSDLGLNIVDEFRFLNQTSNFSISTGVKKDHVKIIKCELSGFKNVFTINIGPVRPN